MVLGGLELDFQLCVVVLLLEGRGPRLPWMVVGVDFL